MSVTLDAGALIALERGDRRLLVLVDEARKRGLPIAIPAGVVAQVWRDGRTQVALARLLSSSLIEIEPLDDASARAAGVLCGASGTSDVIDASVVLCARRRGHSVVTSDPDDLERLDGNLTLVRV